ncbi:MAG: serine acetyltransferase [Ignavibacteriae bacterium]|nr:serine acetyltransferase [Ignavibacteriota bacterium]MCB0750653.1 serine acetyltransferase [Ignavibacteriota bacterium]MCB9208584.1 serine acetyltransferase [Ignavibacteriales bacterium]MCB9258306.1 serine acetyltransferase [Ignavibacteriales bacterium]
MEAKYLDISREILEIRRQHKVIKPIKVEAHRFINDLLQLLFPHFTSDIYYSPEEVAGKVSLLKRNLKSLLISLNNNSIEKIDEISEKFFEKMFSINQELWKDAEAICEGDPAAHSVDEVILAYPGFRAIAIFRFAHELFELKVPILPRILTEYAHQETGIDIHPGATIGHSFFIDHGTGIVIGETTEIGNNVKIYQGVTLGALSVEKKLAQTKRHPTIKDNVIIYAQAVILGGNTTIGENSIIGGNVWLTESVPANSIVYHKSEVRLRNTNEPEPLEFII